MSLDKNLYTLWIVPSEQSPGDVDCVDPPSSEVIYRKRKREVLSGPEYFWSLFDPISEACLASVTAVNATAKTKVITLHDPEIPVQLSFSGTISFKWNFVWEGHDFEWRKDACFLIRKPDPPVQVAVTDPPKKGKSASVQMLDYNLRRFDIDDRKGLEIVMLCALLSFADYTEAYHQQQAGTPPITTTGTSSTSVPAAAGALSPTSPAPAPPPIVRVRSVDANEIIITEEGSVHDYATHCSTLLADPDILFIILKSSTSSVVQRVVQIAEETKRLRHRATDGEEELHQYLKWNEEPEQAKKGKKVIRLDDKPEPKKDPTYKPLTNLTLHLSKIPLPELMPKKPTPTPSPLPSSSARPPSPPKSSFFGRRPNPSSTPSSSKPASSSSARPANFSPPNSSGGGGKLQKPASAGQGKHARSSSAEPRPSARPQGVAGSSNGSGGPPSGRPPRTNPNGGTPPSLFSSSANLAPSPGPGPRPGGMQMPRPRPVSAYGSWGAGPSPGPSMPGGLPAPSLPARPVTPQYPSQPPPPQQQGQVSGTQQAVNMLSKLWGKI